MPSPEIANLLSSGAVARFNDWRSRAGAEATVTSIGIDLSGGHLRDVDLAVADNDILANATLADAILKEAPKPTRPDQAETELPPDAVAGISMEVP